MPPRAIKFPAANGDQEKGFRGKWDVGIVEDEKTGMFDSQAPSVKKHVIANQHIVAMTPHC